MPLCTDSRIPFASPFRTTVASLQRRVVSGALEEDPRASRLAHDEIWRAEHALRLAAEPVQSASADEVAPERPCRGVASGHPGTLREGDDVVTDRWPIPIVAEQEAAGLEHLMRHAIERTLRRAARARGASRNQRSSEAIRDLQSQTDRERELELEERLAGFVRRVKVDNFRQRFKTMPAQLEQQP